MLMSYPPPQSHHHHHSQPQPSPSQSSSASTATTSMYAMAPPAALTTSDMQRRRDAYATTTTSAAVSTPSRSLGTPSSASRHVPLHDQKYDPRDAASMLYAPSDSTGGPNTSSDPADASERQHYHPQHRMYPSAMPSPFASQAPSAFDYMHSSQHHHSSHHSHHHPSQLMSHSANARVAAAAAYGASSTPSPTSAHSAVHPMSQDMSAWGSMPYTSAPLQSQTSGAPASGTSSGPLSGLPEMRSDFGESHSMFAIEDDYNDAKILREVLQDQHHAHQSDTMPSRHGLSYPLHHHQHQHPTQLHHDAPPYSSYPSMSLMGTGASVVDPSNKVGMYMSLDHLAQIRSASASMATGAPLSLMSNKPLTSTSPSSSYVSSSAGSPLGSSRGSSTSSSTVLKKKPASRICRMPGCTKGIRSRGLCKGHGGGRRCTTPGCEISDQGGGHCIAHGGGKRCNVAGCQKSAQSKGLCKLHGGARRCKILNCSKNCQIKGLCRLHYSMYAAAASGPQSSVAGESTSASGSGSFSPNAPFPMPTNSAGSTNGASFV